MVLALAGDSTITRFFIYRCFCFLVSKDFDAIETYILKTNKRKEIAQKIKEARAQGDLSENAEYDAAKEQQGEVETRIAELEKLLRNVQVIDEGSLTNDQVQLGNHVRLFDFEFDEEIEYTIVGSTEANPMEGRISNESPVGQAILGAAVGDTVEVQTPAGVSTYKVLEISAN